MQSPDNLPLTVLVQSTLLVALTGFTVFACLFEGKLGKLVYLLMFCVVSQFFAFVGFFIQGFYVSEPRLPAVTYFIASMVTALGLLLCIYFGARRMVAEFRPRETADKPSA